ncbi:bifunctional DNA-formamidopyrimidine glycosylase/DNA-(apurinic or apyrimidinic site) lyase [Methylocystis sp. B8]|uniref:bifunctional DNA-formamidopyrimidine glycosylase/DNA-(apurinic or apyrimidinic site) lyase n=1 Tax=Methylocystis sp. B8 TaxID=544938 RepID=UPI0010FDD1B3|nr:bifunctional DNA-formamidopyrimidine glycosylase/DNA-(apurinic or apyrimidinic site) lyase [Methylocystis sp. B8]TLG76951.1 bifunctional DNA-formamidopyrimidine glycosylase/DNA-(apurinic or apyrimidinic site) lyase [Methylocystis sp. B8]
MPELPEVETVRRGLAPALVGATIERVELRRHNLRFPFPERFASRLQGRRVLDLRRRAKYLMADLDDSDSLIMHLGMSGSFRIDEETPGATHHKRDKNAAHDHVIFHLSHGKRVIYNDPRRFGYMLLIPTHGIDGDKLFRDLGVEPLSDALDGAFLARAFRGRAAPVKALLLDQRLIAGLGNIYVCEALYRARISPLRAARSLVTESGKPSAALARLPRAIKDVLKDALKAGGSSLRDHRQIDGSLGYFQHSFRVYDREGAACPTPGCKGTITRVVQSGRSTFYCPRCQK